MVPAIATLTTPPADAEEQIKTNLLFQEQKAEKNIYAMLGVEQPSRDDGPQWQKYNEARAKWMSYSSDQNQKRVSEK